MSKTFVLTVSLILMGTAVGFSQKFGYCNSAALLVQLPEVKAADSELKDFQTMLTKKGQDMVKALQDKATELKRKEERGEIAPKDVEVASAKLAEEEEGIRKYEQEVYQKLSEKREALYKPLLERVNKAMGDVAKEGGYSIVFDSSTQALLYAHESLDVTNIVKTKLGITIK